MNDDNGKIGPGETVSTPVSDFVKAYAESGALRLHMPGHKGRGKGFFKYDITEIEGADSLYEADGIIAESEKNAAGIFKSGLTVYSAEGSSLCIKSMCALALKLFYEKERGKKPVILAGRNAHRSFIHAAELIGFDIVWIAPDNRSNSLCECKISLNTLDKCLKILENGDRGVAAVYITSPDYLGGMADVEGLSEITHKHNTILICDDAHGAYLKFLKDSLHPLDLGADLVCDSAHKTLPVLTGGAYLHIGKKLYERMCLADADSVKYDVKQLMLKFGSTSPSYLILASLDEANRRIYEMERDGEFARCAGMVAELKEKLAEAGYVLYGNEPFKLTVDALSSGFESGRALEGLLREQKIECEYCDHTYLTMMWSTENSEEEYSRVYEALKKIGNGYPKKPRKRDGNDDEKMSLPEAVFSPRDVLFMKTEKISARESEGRIAAEVFASCPPAVLPVIPGERINRDVIKKLNELEISEITVLAAKGESGW